MVFHGCKGAELPALGGGPPDGGLYNGTTFVQHRLRPLADTNRLVVLFPQAVSIPWEEPQRLLGLVGHTDAHYATRDGIQIRSVRDDRRLASGRHD